MRSKDHLSGRLAKLNEERVQMENRMNRLWEMINENDVQESSYDLVKEVLKSSMKYI